VALFALLLMAGIVVKDWQVPLTSCHALKLFLFLPERLFLLLHQHSLNYPSTIINNSARYLCT
jgi:hypothetical protein